MEYTHDQLRIQLGIIQDSLKKAKEWKKEIEKIDYSPAKNYGEDVRYNHARQVRNLIEYYQKRIISIMMQMEEIKQ